jgi:hypothetical protein
MVLTCSLTLALPPGWCCMFLARAVEKLAPGSRACCACTEPESVRSAPANDTPLSPAPSPYECPCTERNTTLPKSGTEKADFEPALLAVPSINNSAPPGAGVVQEVAGPGHSRLFARHAMYCCWLC